MVGKRVLGSADELNIDSFFREQSGGNETVAKEDEGEDLGISKKAPEEKVKKPGKKSKKQADKDSDDDIDLEDEGDDEDDLGKKQADDDSDDDIDLEDEDDLDEEDLAVRKRDVSKEIDALSKKATNAETQRAQMQSERDSYKAQFEKASSSIDSLTEKVEQLTELTKKLTKKTEQSDTLGLFTGDDNALMTEGQIKKILEGRNKSEESDLPAKEKFLTEKEVKKMLAEQSKPIQDQSKPKIGSDEEAEKLWANSQPDVVEVSNYYSERKVTLDPELATVPSLDGRYNAVRLKIKEAELRSIKKAYKKLKQKINRMDKGELPETASGSRRKPSDIGDNKPTGDSLVDFFNKRR